MGKIYFKTLKESNKVANERNKKQSQYKNLISVYKMDDGRFFVGTYEQAKLRNPIKKRYYVNIDMSDMKSIKSAERKKSMYENKGYKLVKNEQVGFDKYRLTYEE